MYALWLWCECDIFQEAVNRVFGYWNDSRYLSGSILFLLRSSFRCISISSCRCCQHHETVFTTGLVAFRSSSVWVRIPLAKSSMCLKAKFRLVAAHILSTSCRKWYKSHPESLVTKKFIQFYQTPTQSHGAVLTLCKTVERLSNILHNISNHSTYISV